VVSLYKDALKLEKTGQFDHSFHYRKGKRTVVTKVDKVKIAHEVVKSPLDLDVLDLRKMVVRLVSFIRSANDFGES
jgi:DNA/RNA-binding domain of Phe-tRNA-synthetase-like protein